MAKELSKDHLYLGVKSLLESPDPHLHLHQQKLFTLFSISFQYLLYSSTKNPGHYLIRVEDSFLAEKISHRAKDPSTRSFIARLMTSRKLKYGNSLFHLDYFNIQSWSLVPEISQKKILGALVAKNTIDMPLKESNLPAWGEEGPTTAPIEELPDQFYYYSLIEYIPKTIIIAFNEQFKGIPTLAFPFIKESDEHTPKGVKLSSDLNFDDL